MSVNKLQAEMVDQVVVEAVEVYVVQQEVQVTHLQSALHKDKMEEPQVLQVIQEVQHGLQQVAVAQLL